MSEPPSLDSTSLSHTEAQHRPPAFIIRRAIFYTGMFHLIGIAFLFFWYFNAHTKFTLGEILQNAWPVIIGVGLGIAVSWYVFPKSYSPKYWEEFFPQRVWVLLWYILLGPLTIVIFSGVSLFEIHRLPFSPNSPLTSNFYHTENIALLTYLTFFGVLGWMTKTYVKNIQSLSSNSYD